MSGDAVKPSGDAPDITVTADSSGTANFPAADFSADYHTVYAQTVDGQANASDTYRPVSFYVAPARPDLPDAGV